MQSLQRDPGKANGVLGDITLGRAGLGIYRPRLLSVNLLHLSTGCSSPQPRLVNLNKPCFQNRVLPYDSECDLTREISRISSAIIAYLDRDCHPV